MKTSELTGPALDWAVAKCEGFTQGLVFGRGAVCVDGLWEKPCATGGVQGYVLSHDWMRLHRECEDEPFTRFTKVWSPSTDWSQGGPIIEREELCLEIHEGGHTRAAFYNMRTNFDGKAKGYGHAFGPTPLIAAMRCFCCAKLGDEIDIPEALCQSQNS